MTDDLKRPYAPPANVIAVIRRTRQINLPDVIDNDFLRVAQISENLYGRVHDGMRFLGLVDEGGHPTDALAAISAAGEEEYRSILAGAVREAFAEDFNRVDPGQDTQAVIVDAFKRYAPRSQTKRMVMLFLGLCREAGIPVAEAPRERKMAGAPARKRSPGSVGQATKTPKDRSNSGGGAPTGPASSDTLLGVTVEDIALLDENDFAEVWSALGKIARARGRASLKPPTTDGSSDEGSEGGQI